MKEKDSSKKPSPLEGQFPFFSRCITLIRTRAQFFRRFLTWTTFRRFALTLAVIATLVAVFYTYELYRGKRAWSGYQSDLIKRNIPLSLNEILPQRVPDDQNFAMTPLLAPVVDLDPSSTNVFKDPDGAQRVMEISLSDHRTKKGRHISLEGFDVGKQVDLAYFQSYFQESDQFESPEVSGTPAQDILFGLEKFRAELEEIREASRRPYSRFKMLNDNEESPIILVPHLSVLKNMNSILTLRALASLSDNTADSAFADLELMFSLNKSLAQEPFLITQLVRRSMLEGFLQVLWEGLIGDHWTEPQLLRVQEHLTTFDWFEAFDRGLAAERAVVNEYISMLRVVGDKIGALDKADQLGTYKEQPSLSRRLLSSIIPVGWIYMEQVNFHRAYDDFIFQGIDHLNRKVDIQKLQSADIGLQKFCASGGDMFSIIMNHRVISKMMVPAVSGTRLKMSLAQNYAHLAQVACLLTAHKIREGQLPDSLTELTHTESHPLPNDVITGHPFHYHREGDEHFSLYSAGWNQVDDGGQLSLEAKRGGIQVRKGDWVWHAREVTKVSK